HRVDEEREGALVARRRHEVRRVLHDGRDAHGHPGDGGEREPGGHDERRPRVAVAHAAPGGPAVHGPSSHPHGTPSAGASTTSDLPLPAGPWSPKAAAGPRSPPATL